MSWQEIALPKTAGLKRNGVVAKWEQSPGGWELNR
jgi:hypothetical protein